MTDYIPFEIQSHIIKMLPIISIVQCRSVSKSWKFFIDSSEFITDYNVLHTQPQRILIGYVDSDEEKHISLVDDDDTFPWQKHSLSVPATIKKLYEPRLVGCSQGLFCFFSYMEKPSDFETKTAVLWNPAIRKSIDIVVPNVLDWPYQTFVGFGVCPRTNDPKLVKISNNRNPLEIDYSIPCIPWQVEVFTLSSGIWRSPLINVPRKAIVLSQSLEVIDGFIYWLAYKRIRNIDLTWCNLIMSFDVTSEEFNEVYLPNSLTYDRSIDLYSSTLKESLVVLEFDNGREVYGVWMMEHGVSKSFTKLYNINTPNAWIGNVIGFRNSGEPIVQMIYGFEERGALVVYDPHSENVNYIGICGKGFTFFGSSYVETPLLLNQ
ncbi:putative F-box protein At1g47790 [Rutidosis leptorrhynchoides]|uniref:putative F-box protein At1g47790 n=1 Tax=Rutidosis leptorrhynchoides TaxID=125765 RepID=UPI003A99811D